MDKLQEKYLDDKINSCEIQQLQEELAKKSDDEIGEEMERNWIDGRIKDEDVADDIAEQRIFDKIETRIDKSDRRAKLKKWLSIAAVVIVLLVPASMVLFNSIGSSEDVVLYATNAGETKTVVLPDGTSISMKENSTLQYDKSVYNKKKRQLNYSGEGYFEVSHNKNCPFSVKTADFTVVDLGTRFLLCSREKENISTVKLISGSISVNVAKTGKTVIMKPGEKVTFNRTSFNLSKIVDMPESENLIFNGKPFMDVVNSIEQIYGVSINIDTKNHSSFTGTLTGKDLDTDIQIICAAYGMRAQKIGRNITLK